MNDTQREITPQKPNLGGRPRKAVSTKPARRKTIDTEVAELLPRDKPYKHSVGGGLYVYMPTSGQGRWRHDYRFNGKQTLSIGRTADFTYQEAVDQVSVVRKKVALNEDPRIAVKAAKSVTLKDAVTKVWGNRRDVTPRYALRIRAQFDRHLTKHLGRDIRHITKVELLAALMVIDNAGKGVTARRMRGWAEDVWDWAVEHGYADINAPELIDPEKAFARLPKKQGHAFLREHESPAFFRRLAAEEETLGRLATMLLCLTGVRTAELRGIQWKEIREADRMWVIPASRMKMKEQHWVPLSDQAWAIVLKLKEMQRESSPYLLPHPRKDDRTLSENGVLSVIADIGYGPGSAEDGEGSRQTGHGFRAMLSTWANERKRSNGYDRDAIEAILAHAERDESREAYNYAEYLPERKIILQDFANWVETQSKPVVAA